MGGHLGRLPSCSESRKLSGGALKKRKLGVAQGRECSMCIILCVCVCVYCVYMCVLRPVYLSVYVCILLWETSSYTTSHLCVVHMYHRWLFFFCCSFEIVGNGAPPKYCRHNQVTNHDSHPQHIVFTSYYHIIYTVYHAWDMCVCTYGYKCMLHNSHEFGYMLIEYSVLLTAFSRNVTIWRWCLNRSCNAHDPPSREY